MKKPLLALYSALAFGLSALSICQPAWSSFSTQEMTKVRVDSLDFKHIMRALYAGKMTQYYVDDDDLTAYPHIGLTENFDDNRTLALMHPVLTYKNHQGQTRHLVVIEKVAINDDGGLIGGHVNHAKADLYIFKPVAGGYQLVSKSDKDDDFTGSWGRLNLDLETLAKNMQPLGKNLTGSLIDNGYCSTGSCEIWWEALLLPENDHVRMVQVAEAGGSNAGMYEEDSPLFYGFDSTFKVVNDGSAYYPITIHYTGDKPDNDNDEHIKQVNYKQTFRFSPASNRYQ